MIMPDAASRFYGTETKKPYKKSLTAQYSNVTLQQIEHMMRDAIIHGAQFKQGIFLDTLWQAELSFTGNPIDLRFSVYTQSSKAVDKMSGNSYCEFSLQPGLTHVENQYNASMNEVLNENRMLLVPYTPMIPVRKDILEKCASIVRMMHNSQMISQTISDMQSGGTTQAIRTQAKIVEGKGSSKTTKSSTPNRKKGLFGMFKR